jgi:hypothetical protein
VVSVSAHLTVGAAPDISLEGGTLSFLKVPVGSADTQSLFVTNRGSAPLEISAVAASPAVFETAPGPFTLSPGQEMEAAVTFRPTAPGTVIGALTFRSNDPDEAVATVVLSGNAIQAGPTIVGVAAFELEPRLLDARRREGWIIAKVELLPGYDPARVVLSTVKLLGRVPTVDRALRIGDFNRNGIPDLKFRFRRDQVLLALPEGDRVDVPITGEIRDSTFFHGVETVRVFHRPGDHHGDDDDMIVEEPAIEAPQWEAVPSVAGLETESGAEPLQFTLYPNAPNTVRGETVFRFDTPSAGNATIRIFSVDGRLVRQWDLGSLPAGRHRLHWDARSASGQRLAAGIYFSRFEVSGAEPFAASRRVLLLR